MIKEFILAIILGGILGFGITGSIFALTKNRPTDSPKTSPIVISPDTQNLTTPIQTSPSPVPNQPSTNTNPSTLQILSPLPNSIVTNSKIEVKGNTASKSIITVTTFAKTFTSTADSNGDFIVNVDLESGANLLNISAIDTSDKQSDIQVLITYSTAKI